MCYVVFGVVCSVVFFCVMSQNSEETAEFGTGRKELRSPEPEVLHAFKCKYRIFTTIRRT